MLGQFVIVYNGADNGAYPFAVTMILLVVYDLLLFALLWRWSGKGAAWDDRHRLALIIGALSLLLVFGPITVGNQ